MRSPFGIGKALFFVKLLWNLTSVDVFTAYMIM